jgi:GAF domain-containing protein
VTGMRIPATQGIAGWVVQSGQPIAISDVASDPRFSRQVAEQTGYLPQAILAVPVQTHHRILGVISLLDRDARRPGAEQDMALLSLFADQAALALASVEAFGALGRVLLGALAEAAASDDLTHALRRAAAGLPAADADLAALATSFAALVRRGTAERRLALAVLRDVADYAERRSSRTR